MRVIYNRLIPFKGFKAINLFGVVFARRGAELSEADLRHEYIHTLQMRELHYAGFYALYLWYWLRNLARGYGRHAAYRLIPFEREAYGHQGERWYTHGGRVRMAWRAYT